MVQLGFRWKRRSCYRRSELRSCPFPVCAVTRRRFPVGASPTRQPVQPEAIGAVMEVTKWLKPSVSVSRIGDSASVQAVTRVNAEQSSKRTMRRPTRQPFRGRLIRLGEAERRVRPADVPPARSKLVETIEVGGALGGRYPDLSQDRKSQGRPASARTRLTARSDIWALK
jgi:hypothetical protein